ncbi:MAG TPA: glycosyl hydrolase family 28 protein [Candidatus Acidoferrales bacterium]|nr:glycosyl hydrolase family 28 protein [Candidatus Acidoferrales bacterium]
MELRPDGANDAFVSGPIEMKRGVTLLVAADTTLFASRNPRDYDVQPGSCGIVDTKGGGCKPLLHFLDAPDAGVMGDGIIDGRGGATLAGEHLTWWDLAEQARVGNRKQNVPRIIVAESSNNFTLYRITLRNSPNFHVFISKTNGFTAWGVRIDAPRTARNTDGIDPSSSTNVSILYSYIRDGDDNVAIKAGNNGLSTHITVAHDHFYSGHGMSIGSETNGGVSQIEVNDLTIDGADNGLRIKSDTSRGGLVQDIVYRNVCMRQVKNPILISPFYSTASGNKIPLFQGILMRNIVTTTPGKITLEGRDASHLLQLTLDGVTESGVASRNVVASHARIRLGPGSVNFAPVGDDVQIAQVKGRRATPACSAEFVPFPNSHIGPER